jgi:hypothetical protein
VLRAGDITIITIIRCLNYILILILGSTNRATEEVQWEREMTTRLANLDAPRQEAPYQPRARVVQSNRGERGQEEGERTKTAALERDLMHRGLEEDLMKPAQVVSPFVVVPDDGLLEEKRRGGGEQGSNSGPPAKDSKDLMMADGEKEEGREGDVHPTEGGPAVEKGVVTSGDTLEAEAKEANKTEAEIGQEEEMGKAGEIGMPRELETEKEEKEAVSRTSSKEKSKSKGATERDNSRKSISSKSKSKSVSKDKGGEDNLGDHAGTGAGDAASAGDNDGASAGDSDGDGGAESKSSNSRSEHRRSGKHEGVAEEEEEVTHTKPILTLICVLL